MNYLIEKLANTIPNGWRILNLNDILDTFESGSRPYGGMFNEQNGSIPSFGGENIDQKGMIEYNNIKKISYDFFSTMTKGKLKDGDVLINKDGAQTGKVGYYRNKYYNLAAINEHLFLLRGDSFKVTQKYLFYFLLSDYGQKLLKQKITGSAQPGLNSRFVNNFSVIIPEGIHEQQKIADILTTVDNIIEKTEQLIEKYKKVKEGMMQDLFTRGIDENGNLRPSYEQAPHLYKETELGMIPKEWDANHLENISDITRLAGAEYSDVWYTVPEGEIIALRGYNVGENELDLSNIETITFDLSKRLNRSKLFKGDIVFPCVGSIGKAALIYEDNRYHINQNIAKITPNEKMDPLYLTYFLMSSHIKKEINKYNASSSQPNVLVGNLRKFSIAVPKINEQIKIAKKLSKINDVLKKEEKYKIKLKKLKQGLMQDLLTGKVRVKV
ncbi:restriction endonuclease subunit S [Natranaerobius trueperi]|uniref:Restriction endonuclease subunit S n=1 Tax=Natranaerobius trueperi TaxID=759412 RepID=A0A226C137_9FIRM|nr:restriction endonuclease subunit S [Natranaerobius trueperi]OWZ84097.1 restriction endonuclease subunit S [Natranaerobius trueperi]